MDTEISQAESRAKAIAARECNTFGEDFLSTPLVSGTVEPAGIRIHTTPTKASGNHVIDNSEEIFSTIPTPLDGLGLPFLPSKSPKEEKTYSRADRE